MGINVKEMIDKVVDKAKKDPDFMSKLQKDPEKAIESVLGMDIPDGVVDQVMAAVRGKAGVEKLTGLLDKFKK